MRMHSGRNWNAGMNAAGGRPPLSDVLRTLANDANRERISIRDLIDALGDRALAALMFVFALPNVIPTPPGTSSVLGAPLIFLTAQLALGRKPWLPDFVCKRSISFDDFRTLVRRVAPWLQRAERLLRPRATRLAVPPMEYVVGLVCFVLSVILALPIPLGNIPPALAICFMALGILEQDGWWIVAGFIATVVAVAVVSGVLFAMFETVQFVGNHVL